MLNFFNAYILFPYLEKKSGRLISAKLAELRQFDKLSLEQKKSIQKSEFYKILEFSKNNNLFYKNYFQKHNFDIELIKKDIKYIEKLPILTKEVIKENAHLIKSAQAHHERKTGGSTGQSVVFYYDDVGLDWTSAINSKAYEMAKNWPHRKDSHISSELGIPFPSRKSKFYDFIKLTSQNRTRIMIHSFSDQDMKLTFKQLKSRRPYLLQGHPSSAFAIAQYIKDKNLEGPQFCQVFEPSGEALNDKMVADIEKYLKCKVVNRYGNAEFGVMAHSKWGDDYKKLSVFDRAFYIEPTTENSLIVSNCTNYGFPLFRYDTGDVGTVKVENDGTYIYDLKGRIHDNVIINNQVFASHYIMDYLDHKIRGIREFQIWIKENETPLLAVVTENSADQERIHKMIYEKWPTGLTCKFIDMSQLKKVGWQNKFRHCVKVESYE